MPRAPLTPSLYVPDMDAALAFYVGTLGFRQTGDYKNDAGAAIWAEVSLGEARIWMFTHAIPGRPEPAFSGLLYIFVDDVNRWAETLAGKVEVRWGPDTMDYGLRELGIEDPNGYILVFAQDV